MCWEDWRRGTEGKVRRTKDEGRRAVRERLFANVTHAKAGDIRIGTRTTDEMQRPFRASYFVLSTCLYSHNRNNLLVFYVVGLTQFRCMENTLLNLPDSAGINEIILYQGNELPVRIEVRIAHDSVWLNRNQIALLFKRDVKTIGKHINNIFKEGELDKKVVVAKFATTTAHGAIQGKTQTLIVDYYNLDVIISVGYRVKSREGTLFRIWASKVLKDYLMKGYAMHIRTTQLESNFHKMNERIEHIEVTLKTHQLPTHGIFFENQIFDAYTFFSDIVARSKHSIILIDNYIDHTVLLQLAKRQKNVSATIYTERIPAALQLDLAKHNAQYPPITIHRIKQVHDRFLLIDEKELYHIGSSIKDLGKRWFAFSRMDSLVRDVAGRLMASGEWQVAKGE
jgi:hypothetical protein